MAVACTICSVALSSENTYRGVTSRCRACHKAAVQANRAAKVDYYRAYDAARFHADPRVKNRHRLYRNSDAGKAAFGRARERWLADNPEKRRAHCAVNNAVRDGKIMKPSACSRCGSEGVRLDGHHADYSKPLEVEWLCRGCHVEEHLGPVDERRAGGFEPLGDAIARLKRRVEEVADRP